MIQMEKIMIAEKLQLPQVQRVGFLNATTNVETCCEDELFSIDTVEHLLIFQIHIKVLIARRELHRLRDHVRSRQQLADKPLTHPCGELLVSISRLHSEKMPKITCAPMLGGSCMLLELVSTLIPSQASSSTRHLPWVPGGLNSKSGGDVRLWKQTGSYKREITNQNGPKSTRDFDSKFPMHIILNINKVDIKLQRLKMHTYEVERDNAKSAEEDIHYTLKGAYGWLSASVDCSDRGQEEVYSKANEDEVYKCQHECWAQQDGEKCCKAMIKICVGVGNIGCMVCDYCLNNMGYCLGCCHSIKKTIGHTFKLKSCGCTTGGWVCLLVFFSIILTAMIFYSHSGGASIWAHEGIDAMFPMKTAASGPATPTMPTGAPNSTDTATNKTT
ncbi:hypothetical protein DACRYDRAFT_16098 [Dacryopinax primogenitus]|uniref:Uncharacterized protein n=1 Tax=Dacryopinax primogenitus (strain DJM 731) TaxID=1858805 RepID=M5FUG5_DACPD|nr:uncharacterized protein DACRYDRAFT_16098 [Dacryopinax primogenitus]EJU01381.1 hypothetical protein DACRYDRAFT_16098 [Dacryopinax primogenitus]